ncbi:hypothetical protein QUA81_17595 [Microcoleus sp. F6_B4]
MSIRSACRGSQVGAVFAGNCDRLPLAKRSKVCCSIESRTYVHQAGFYPKQAAAQPSIEAETRFLVERVSPRLLDAAFVS